MWLKLLLTSISFKFDKTASAFLFVWLVSVRNYYIKETCSELNQSKRCCSSYLMFNQALEIHKNFRQIKKTQHLKLELFQL